MDLDNQPLVWLRDQQVVVRVPADYGWSRWKTVFRELQARDEMLAQQNLLLTTKLQMKQLQAPDGQQIVERLFDVSPTNHAGSGPFGLPHKVNQRLPSND